MPGTLLRPQSHPAGWTGALVALLCAAAAHPLVAQTWGRYGVSVYEIEGFDETGALDLRAGGVINNSGQVAGTIEVYGEAGEVGGEAAVFKPSGGETLLGTLGGRYSYGYGINNAGQATGYSDVDEDGAIHAFLYDGTMRDLGTLGGTNSYGHGINDRGQVTGESWVSGDGTTHVFLYDGTMHDLGTLGGSESHGSGINNAGWVTGGASLIGDSIRHAFLYDGAMHDLGTLGGTNSYGSGINSAGWVAGSSELSDGSSVRAFLYSAGTMHDLGTLSIADSYGYDISDDGMVVGMANYQAVLWESIGGRYQAYSFADIVNRGRSPEWIFDWVRGISDDGTYVLARGYNTSTRYGGWVVLEQNAASVTPEPTSLLLLGTGLAALGGLRCRRGS